MHIKKNMTAAAVVALMASTAANAQMFGNEYGSDLDNTRFQEGLAGTGTYGAWDRDATPGLNRNEFASGIYADWDRDNDLRITEDEYNMGAQRWYGPDYATPYATYDADQSGYIDQKEFGANWNDDYYNDWDLDDDGLLTEDEYGTGLYGRADVDQDKVITIEEEGWFEGWFDGDDVEAEIKDVGDVLDS